MAKSKPPTQKGGDSNSPWQNRIVGYETIPAGQLTANPLNWRIHPGGQQQALEGVIDSVGWVQNVIVNKRTGNMIDGHLRATLALRRGEDTPVPVTIVDLSEEEEAVILASLDPLAAMAGTDKAKLDELLHAAQSDNEKVQGLLANIAEQSGLQYGAPPPDDPGAQIDRADELRVKWGVELGQLWRIPSLATPGAEHRIICGDCTDAAVVARVMGGEKAELAPVDPPYNVGFDYDGKTVDDTKNTKAYEDFSRAWFGLCQEHSERQLVTPGCNNLALWLRWFDAYHWGVWTKTNSMTNGRVSRFWCWEPVLFFGEHWGKSRHDDIFNYPIGQQKDTANHPCPKPLEMWCDILENYSKPGAIILECFNGSGTTLIACERLARLGRGVEISPAYVAVALERLAGLGLKPELVQH